ncbi:Metallo-dependent phosphatase [Dissoconium aciculare CBS 342.82]|uniref:Metallo-dependent phosphatase n=1 Tax=Dissoconium aciculare CBS 342.82 TaxID=1314786 RepID=A0A6J3M9M1_9PEZI|nr:Metallo-dependent phosphatase [Dissoconium aciculare CBS 342.82]KAF1824543.1 Metallo-dependent phosphatase [Dissoconium aciculare CBS 342.82]
MARADTVLLSTAPLAFSNGSFQIAVFEDLHFGENYWEDWGPKQDVNTVLVINEVLDQENPQLSVLNGDLITGNNAFRENSTAVIDKLVAPFVKRGLSWASTYGNHDSDFNLSRADILRAEHKYPNARTTNMMPNDRYGVTNYYLPVYPSNASLDTPSLILWFFDSRGGFYYDSIDPATGKQVGQPDWVDEHVVDWFTSTNAALTKQHGKVIPSIAFVHIPVNASLALQQYAGVDSHRQPGINDDYLLGAQAQGWCEDNVSNGTCAYGKQDIPFMKAITSTPRLLALFSGHDHGDTWCYKWRKDVLPNLEVQGNGINLCFGQHSGYGGYGSWTRGSRQIRIRESDLQHDSISTWIRLENSQVVGAVELNSTYGRDIYPVTPNTHS